MEYSKLKTVIIIKLTNHLTLRYFFCKNWISINMLRQNYFFPENVDTFIKINLNLIISKIWINSNKNKKYQLSESKLSVKFKCFTILRNTKWHLILLLKTHIWINYKPLDYMSDFRPTFYPFSATYSLLRILHSINEIFSKFISHKFKIFFLERKSWYILSSTLNLT